MELQNINKLEQATFGGRKELFRIGMALLFIVGIMLFISMRGIEGPGQIMLMIAAMIGGYMAMNIGANDVANNVGPAVGSKALTLTGAIIIAAVFEASGALLAGGDVVSTIKKGIIDPALIGDADTFIWLMLAALLAGALWLNIATALGAPVSTTHSIVGGVLGAGIAAGGVGIANWGQLGAIAASWVISPVLGGVIAAAFLYLIKRTITYREDMIAAARGMVPLLVGIMAWAFSTYLALKGLKKLVKMDFGTALVIGLGVAVVIYFIVRPLIARLSGKLSNDKESINRLFTLPLIFAAALLSFAHGANDVANAVGPLAAINDAILHGGVVKKASIPFWVMMVGATGIAIGLALYGPKLIRTVGSEITELDKMRAFCIAMAAAITVIVATQMGLPVSSTHIAVGGVFGVGFLREFLKTSYGKMVEEIKRHHADDDPEAVEAFLMEFKKASVNQKKAMLTQLKEHTSEAHLSKKERKSLRRVYRHELVKRSALLKIAAAWVITVPVSGIMAALLYFMIRGMMLP
ncbi:MAG: inorganic phosphate transporter [Candidatus Sedimenticola endophacoides]|uniref:Phosphate transporter n=1 Tax=Candidatus Sedimenticola endophacoides TaxID=2548426 RepID=A0A657PZ99_9GAMM|nr:MAG: inorganic phosphate transporter [Candidatus Sedimenticola endophacoides]OQX37939.1 MAG: inorganic phosphate transporter [Candidatus Sedimenticola endophacoides]OQX38901.1 MAG: inorganic phosphate transporter [Candidatus Sedimenticola endophacoides]OQX45443.1 MAG: inorganic phosphate transporter [Candidatus Sedimenticola endophacoides]OQX45472.1 MAG: inorganic phosphate transporter [Candidatus Sedimenticola endophacoides]